MPVDIEEDTANTNSDLMVSVIESIAQAENESRSENIKWGIKQRAAQGTSKLYDRKCYGYKHDEDGHLVIDEEKAKNVKLIFDLYLGGQSVIESSRNLKSGKFYHLLERKNGVKGRLMPIAISAVDYIARNKLDIKEIVKGVVSLSETLEKLHKKDICHRDIEPSNIYYYNNKFAFGDFGLVDFPDNADDFTKSDKGLGAIFTIASEMKRNPKKADSKKADVFSLAKTMWMFLTNNLG